MCPRRRSNIVVVSCTHPQTRERYRASNDHILDCCQATLCVIQVRSLFRTPSQIIGNEMGRHQVCHQLFIGTHDTIVAINKLGKSDDDWIQDSLELFQTKVGRPFLFGSFCKLPEVHGHLHAHGETQAPCADRVDMPLDQSDYQPSRVHVSVKTLVESATMLRESKVENTYLKLKETTMRANA